LNANDAERPFVFPGDQVADDRIAIRKGRVCLHKRLPVHAKVAEHKMEVMTITEVKRPASADLIRGPDPLQS
jgi:hypothetical protein